MPPEYTEDGKTILRYHQNILRVLNAYQFGSPSLIVGLNALIQTAVDRAKERRVDEIAEQSCMGLHQGAPKGLVCKRCFDSKELGLIPAEEEEETVNLGMTKQQEDAILADVKMLIGAPDDDDG